MTPNSQPSDLEFADVLDSYAEDLKADGYEALADHYAYAALRIKVLVLDAKVSNVLLDAYREKLQEVRIEK